MAGRGTYIGSLAIFVVAAFSIGLVTGVNITKPDAQAQKPCPVENPKPDNGDNGSGDQQPKNGTETAVPAYPEASGFSLTSVETGDALTLADLKGSNALMLIVTTSCPTCREQIDELKKVYETYKAKGVRFFEAIIGEADENGMRFVDEIQAEEHVKESGLPFPAYIDEIDEIPAGYSFESVPVLVFITKEGGLMLVRPFTYAADVARILDALVAGRQADITGMETKVG